MEQVIASWGLNMGNSLIQTAEIATELFNLVNEEVKMSSCAFL